MGEVIPECPVICQGRVETPKHDYHPTVSVSREALVDHREPSFVASEFVIPDTECLVSDGVSVGAYLVKSGSCVGSQRRVDQPLSKAIVPVLNAVADVAAETIL